MRAVTSVCRPGSADDDSARGIPLDDFSGHLVEPYRPVGGATAVGGLPSIGYVITCWTERAFDDQAAAARLVGLSVLALGDLLLLHRPDGAVDWALVLAGLGVCLAGARLPLAATATLSALIVVGDVARTTMGVPLKAMVAVALFELALRGRGRRVAYGAGVSAFFLTLHAMSAPAAEVLPTLYRLSILLGVPLLLGAYVRLISENARQARERADAEERRRRADTLAARAAERTAIARELHDLVAHHVSSMVLRVGVARHVLPDSATDPRVTQVLDDLHASGSAALVDLRRLVAVLRDPAQVGGGPFFSLVDRAALPTALEEAMARVRATGLTVEASIDPAVTDLDAVRGLTVLRLVQEGLANAAKHAGERAEVRVSVQVAADDVVRLEIVDDGGTTAADDHRPAAGGAAGASAALGHGLIGMAERVELFGGRFEAGPPPSGQGWRLYAELPPGGATPERALASDTAEPVRTNTALTPLAGHDGAVAGSGRRDGVAAGPSGCDGAAGVMGDMGGTGMPRGEGAAAGPSGCDGAAEVTGDVGGAGMPGGEGVSGMPGDEGVSVSGIPGVRGAAGMSGDHQGAAVAQEVSS
ncbi:sensor histidine kinase [Nonomuraea candida]|uniref:sensor histidine kinase n=1 Tax=Nonomuraea candida TaxID=359159 RepID=UPI0007C68B2E|nr:histidine kinase [Nonomuraea candida]